MSNNQDQSKGRTDEAAGKAKEVVGGLAGNKGPEVKDPNQKNTGSFQSKPSDVKSDVKPSIPKV
jgi:uncharacterized protein YjbJ (UPF0337 family)